MTAPPSPYAAYLRVYEPLVAFPAAERDAWRTYAEGAPSRADGLAAEHRRARFNLLRVPPLPGPADDHREAFVLDADGEVLICPVQARQRAWAAFEEFRHGLPDTLLYAFVPPGALARVDRDRERWAGGEPPGPLRILTASFTVPLHWFVPFSGEDRRLHLRPRSLLYLARISAARRRVGRALRTLRRSEVDFRNVDELEELGRWLEEFHPRSRVELDYAGLAGLMSTDALRADTSAQDVTAALAALDVGDGEAAEAAYGALLDRWSTVQALQHAN